MRSKNRITRLFALTLAALGTAQAEVERAPLSSLMPRVEDHTSMWWHAGFPKHTKNAKWVRRIQTGHFAFALNTETLEIPQFGPVPPGTAYGARHDNDESTWQKLPPANLELRITVDGRTYSCSNGGKWTRFTGPRLIESGRFFQRGDVTGLQFKDADGERLDVQARFETAAWADRLALILAARPAQGSGSKPANVWRKASMEITFSTSAGKLTQRWELPAGKDWPAAEWRSVSLPINPVSTKVIKEACPVVVRASTIPAGEVRPVSYDSALGWHRVNLDGIAPIVPRGANKPSNDAIERIKLLLTNPTDRAQTARLMFEKTARGFRQRIGTPITGVSAILRDEEGNPTGIPVQLSKNWHNKAEGGVYSGQWFHGISQLHLPASSMVELELTLAYGHWGGVAAASHAQLCLVGWGGNQLWDQSALGSWGESICYDPDRAQAQSAITDVRPLMVRGMKKGRERWGWTVNVGGGDMFRLFNPAGVRVAHQSVRTSYHQHGPCLTAVAYAGRIGDGLQHESTVSISRSDDLVRGTYRLRLNVTKATDFSRLVLFQIGADTYSYTGERKMAVGNETGLIKEWDTQWGGNTYRTQPVKFLGKAPWISLHDAIRRESNPTGAWANRGLVLRSWKARLGGKDAAPWIAERGLTLHRNDSSTIDILPPPGIKRLEPGDFLEATIEHIVMPQSAEDYYGPSKSLRAALEKGGNTWRMIHREAAGNDRMVEVERGKLIRRHPDIRIQAEGNSARLKLTGGLGYVPLTFAGLTSNKGHRLKIDGVAIDQSIHGNDYWQTDYDPTTRTWSRTYNIQPGGEAALVELVAEQGN